MDIAIVICTHNPDYIIFERCIEAVASLQIPPGIQVEGIVVDNNSSRPVSEISFVKEIIAELPFFKIVTEAKPGLTFARLRGLAETKAPVIVFFDDDNEPRRDYLLNLLPLLSCFPEVAVWGAGAINVEFIGKHAEWVDDWKHVFQQRQSETVKTGRDKHWQEYYPLGTGQVVKREILEKYASEVFSGRLTTKDRTGKNLSSAGDVQIAFSAVKAGFSVGISPSLQINHLTSRRKATFSYIKRLHFGTASSYNRALVEIYPEEKKTIYLVSFKKFRQHIGQLLRKHTSIWEFRSISFQLASYAGEVAGGYFAIDRQLPRWLIFFIRVMKFE